MSFLGLPPGIDGNALIGELLSYGALFVPLAAAVGMFFLIAKIFKKV